MASRIAPIATVAVVALLLVATAAPLRAATEDRIAKLEAEVAKLQEQVSNLIAIEPTITNFMPNFSERFHVMHRAGEAGDWAVAQHELLELQRLMGVAKIIDPEKGRLMQSFLGESFEQIDAAIEHEDTKRFVSTLDATVKQCNTCHAAAGSPFINVGLDADRTLSMRHAHTFLKSEPMKGHTHTHGHAAHDDHDDDHDKDH